MGRQHVVKSIIKPHIICGEMYKDKKKKYFINVVDLESGEILNWYECATQTEWKKKLVEVKNQFQWFSTSEL